MPLTASPAQPGTDGPQVQDRLGPVEVLVVEFPRGRISGAGFTTLTDLVDQRVINVLDLEFVRRDDDGSCVLVPVEEAVADGSDDLRVLAGASSGLLDRDDVAAVGDAIAPGSLAGVLLYEQVWLLPMADAFEAGGARLVVAGHVDPAEVIAALADNAPDGARHQED